MVHQMQTERLGWQRYFDLLIKILQSQSLSMRIQFITAVYSVNKE